MHISYWWSFVYNFKFTMSKEKEPKFLWEILVPTQFELGPQNKVRTKHHKKWDTYVRNLSGGLTIFKPAKGQWVHQFKLYNDRVIPVRVYCSESDLRKILKFSTIHYRQIEVMAYRVSDFVIFEKNKIETYEK